MHSIILTNKQVTRIGMALVCLGFILAGCGGASGGTRPATTGSPTPTSTPTPTPGSLDNANGGFPAQIAGETYPGKRLTVDGMIRLADNGCWYLSTDASETMIVFPAGAGIPPDSGGYEVTLASGEKVPNGSAVVGPAAFVAAADLPGMPDSYWGFITGFCREGGDEVVVFDDLAVLTRP